MSIRAVIFDADGVLVFPKRLTEPLTRECQMTREATHALLQNKFDDCLLGKADLSDVLSPYLSEWGWLGSCEAFMQLWFTAENAVNMRVMERAKTLREAGFVCVLATNQERHRAEYMKTAMGFSAKSDALFFSCEMGVKKPDERFYETIEKALGLTGEQIAFWDDTPSHVDAAKRRGWSAEIYTDYEKFQRQTAEILERQTTH